MEEKGHVLFIGLGDYESALLARMTENYQVTVMDIDEKSLAEYQQKFPGLHTIKGDASSIITLKKVDFENVVQVICSIRDSDVVFEICHILRGALEVQVPILVIHYEEVGVEKFAKLKVSFFNPIELGSRAIVNRMEKNMIRPTSIGKGIGEIIEVTVRSASHLTGRKLKHLRPTNWHVSMIYRDDNPMIPTGEMRMQVGDRVILAGQPKVLENIAQLLITGTPQFPLQFGSKLLYPLERRREDIYLEAAFWYQKTRLKKIHYVPYHVPSERMSEEREEFEYGNPLGLFRDILEMKGDFGLLFVELKGLFKNSRLRACFRFATIPFVLSRQDYPYERILVSLNTNQPVVALEAGVEISRMTQLPLEVCFVALPPELRNEEERIQLEARESLIKDYQSIFKINLGYSCLTGNPVRETLRYVREKGNGSLVILANTEESTGPFNRNVPFLISRKTSCSVLVLPGESSHV